MGSRNCSSRIFRPSWIDDWMNQPDLLAARNTLLKELKEVPSVRKRSGLVSESLRIAGNSLKCTSRRSKKFLLLKAKKNSLKPCVRSGAGPEQLRRHYERAQMILRGEETGLLEQIGHLERALELLAGDDEDMAAYLESASLFARRLRAGTETAPPSPCLRLISIRNK